MDRVKLLGALAAFVAFVGPANGAVSAPIDVTVCQVAEDPERYDNRPLRLRATIDSNGGEEYILLIDTSCPKRFLLFDDSFEYDGSDAPRFALRRAMIKMRANNQSRHQHEVVDATMIGVASRKDIEKRFHEFAVESATNVVVRHVPRGRACSNKSPAPRWISGQ